MGRQIAIAATPLDELFFLEFVRTTADIRIAQTNAPCADDLWVDQFSEDVNYHRLYWIWNTSFEWTPKYGQVNADAPGMGGQYFIDDIFQAPVIEFSRTKWDKSKYGRLYWAKDFAAADGLTYDAKGFGTWYDQLVRWVRKNGKKVAPDRFEPYYLPDAYARIMQTQ